MAAEPPRGLRGIVSPVLRWAGGMVVVMSVLFLLTEALPGDYADVVAGADRSGAERVREQQGLDAPVLVRLGRWWWGVLRGDLGLSLIDAQPVLPKVVSRFTATASIALPAAVLAAVAAVGLALLLAWWRGRPGGARLAATVAVVAGLPEIVLVIGLVLLFSIALGLLPPVSLLTPGASPWHSPEILVLPVLALAIPVAAWGAQMMRGSADDVLSSDIVTSARRRGVPAPAIIGRHVLSRWRGPLVQTTAYLTAGILGGSVVVETMFAYPGLGQAMAAAVASRDMPMVQGCGLIVVGISLALLTGVDIVVEHAERHDNGC
ncbi:ABC transporter permease [Propionibacterium australiense]|uniref:ABC transporter permease n=1 Tax=Propionibacterium australiense TaxID=119981 RepID=A0A8B3GE89_9ACTN|nr:ABC transporter permease [Propionibacterium australiense]RLP08369.1 ABC transporter permease [Propionibacterium australiense]